MIEISTRAKLLKIWKNTKFLNFSKRHIPNVGPYKPKKIVFFFGYLAYMVQPSLWKNSVFFVAIWLIWSNPLSEKIVFVFSLFGLYGPALSLKNNVILACICLKINWIYSEKIVFFSLFGLYGYWLVWSNIRYNENQTHLLYNSLNSKF